MNELIQSMNLCQIKLELDSNFKPEFTLLKFPSKSRINFNRREYDILITLNEIVIGHRKRRVIGIESWVINKRRVLRICHRK